MCRYKLKIDDNGFLGDREFVLRRLSGHLFEADFLKQILLTQILWTSPRDPVYAGLVQDNFESFRPGTSCRGGTIAVSVAKQVESGTFLACGVPEIDVACSLC